MRGNLRFGMILGACAAVALAAAPARAANVVITGDSWAHGQDEDYAARFPAGVSVAIGTAIPGMTAQLAADTNLVNNAILIGGGADYVVVSLGGNDVMGAYAAGNGANAAAIVDTQLRRIVDSVSAQFPGIQIVFPGYDWPNFEQSTECIATGLVIFGGLLTPDINLAFLSAIRDVQANIAASYPNVHAVDAFGTLQIAAGTPFAPTHLLPSPESRMADCIHTNNTGDYEFTLEIYKSFFEAIYGPPPGGPGCAIVAAPGEATWSAAASSLILLVPAAAFVVVGRRRRS